jgi:hypothetical protein
MCLNTSTGFCHLVFVLRSRQSTALIETALSYEPFAMWFNVQRPSLYCRLNTAWWFLLNIRCISVLTADQGLDVLRLLFNVKAFLSLCSPAFCYHFSKQTVLLIPVRLKLWKTWAGLTSKFTASDRLFLCMLYYVSLLRTATLGLLCDLS